jgi:hypothetical protein
MEGNGMFNNYAKMARSLGMTESVMQRCIGKPGFPAKTAAGWNAADVGDFIVNRCPGVANSTKRSVAFSLGLPLSGANGLEQDDADEFSDSNSPQLERGRKYKADLLYLQVQEVEGELVRLEDYQSAERERHQVARGNFLRLKDTLPTKCQNLTLEELTDLIGREIDGICATIAVQLEELKNKPMEKNGQQPKENSEQDPSKT